MIVIEYYAKLDVLAIQKEHTMQVRILYLFTELSRKQHLQVLTLYALWSMKVTYLGYFFSDQKH